jgi:hypothetical protein
MTRPPKPVTFNGDLANLPDAFRPYLAEPIWLCWRWVWKEENQKWDKIPSVPNSPLKNARSTDPSTWGTYADAVASAQAGKADGIGLAMQGLSNNEIALDLDDCRNPETGQAEPWALEIIEEANCYCEITPSGEGFRVLGRGAVGKHNAAVMASDGTRSGLEIFTAGAGRYITVTGKALPDCWPHMADIEAVTKQLLANHGRLRPEPQPEAATEPPRQASQEGAGQASAGGGSLGKTISQRALAGSGGSYFRNVNTEALAHLGKWVPDLFPTAKLQPGTGAWRVTSKDLGRNLQEDLSIHPQGGRDFGFEEGKSPIDLVMKYTGLHNAIEAAQWLCDRMGINPATLGWQDRGTGGSREYVAPEAVWNPWRETSAPAFPLDALPDDVARYVEARSVETGACPSAIAMSCLAVASGAASHEAKLHLKPGNGWPVSPRLWVVLVGDPSAKKSPAIGGAVKPLLRYQRAEHARTMETWKAELANMTEKEQKAAKAEGPPLTHFVLNDLTPEKLVDVLARQDRGVLIEADELAGWLGAHDRYAGGRGGASAGRTIWLRSYDGGDYSLLRVSRETTPVRNLSASILGGIQPERLRELGSLTTDGLLQRFLPVMMARSRLDQDVFDAHALRGWEDRIGELVQFGRFSTELSSGARQEFRRVRDVLHVLGQGDSEGAGWQGFVGKLPGVWGSLALLLHVLWGCRAADPVSEETAGRASKILESFVLPHGLDFYRSLVGTAEKESRAIAAFIAGWEKPEIAVRDFQNGPRCCRSPMTPDAIVKKLLPFEAGGWLDPVGSGPWNRRWTVTPNLGARFAAEVASHREAVAVIQAKITGEDHEAA